MWKIPSRTNASSAPMLRAWQASRPACCVCRPPRCSPNPAVRRPLISHGSCIHRTTNFPHPYSSAAAKPDDPHGSPPPDARGWLRMLNDRQRDLLAEQRALVARVRQIASGRGDRSGTADYEEDDSDGAASSTLCVAVAGEFNSGKSTLINALFGSNELLPMGTLPTTETVTIIGRPDDHAWVAAASSKKSGAPGPRKALAVAVVPGAALEAPPILRGVTLVDTPGTNAGYRRTSEALRALRCADVVLWVTSADRPLPESERRLLRHLAEYRPNLLLALLVNKVDVLHASGGDHGQAEQSRLLDYVRKEAARALGGRDLPVLGVSARDALAAKVLQSRGGVWRRSGFEELEDFLSRTLTAQTLIQSKLAGPLGGVIKSMTDCLTLLKAERTDLQQDAATLRLLNLQLQSWRAELDGELRLARQEILAALDQEGERCQVLLRRLRWWGLLRISLFHRRHLELEWVRTRPEAPKGGTLQEHLLELAREMADTAAIRGRAQGQAVIEFLGKRPSVKHQSLVGSVLAASTFEDTRQSLAARLSEAVERILSEEESASVHDERVLIDQLQATCRTAASLGAAAVAALVATALQAVDSAAGIEVGTVLLLGSAGTLSSVRWRTTRLHHGLWARKKSDLEAFLEGISASELERIEQRVQEGIAPYRRFVEVEHARLQEQSDDCQSVISAAQDLISRIEVLES